MRVFACTPVRFPGDHTFFARDSSLTGRRLRSLGVESRAIAPAYNGDEPDLIRAEMRQLESAAWWRDIQLDGVVLYAWGSAQYSKIARAMNKSAARLCVHLDSRGLSSPLADWRDFVREKRRISVAQDGSLLGLADFAARRILQDLALEPDPGSWSR